MLSTFFLDTRSARIRLRRGASVTCLSGTLWLTWEGRGPARSSPDVLLTPTERVVIEAPVTGFLHPLHPGVPTGCRVDMPPTRLQRLGEWLRRWRGPASSHHTAAL